MKLIKSTTKKRSKSSAQAMVEFAIALPILLMLLYGILESGRLLFLYSTVVTASRQAARYGSATGTGAGGFPNYQDCAGMRAAANKAGYLGSFDTITIQYDTGPGTGVTTYCAGASDTSLTSAMLSDNRHRVIVTVSEPFAPIVPKLVPFIARTITAKSSRTVIGSISIQVTIPATFVSATPSNTPTKTATPTNTPTNTSTPTRTFTPSPTSPYTSTPSLTPSMSLTPSKTFTPTNTFTPTYTPTASFTPTASSTPIANCNLLSHGALSISGSTMSMSITNPTGVALTIQDVNVTWNHDAGHNSGIDHTLRLQSGSLSGTFWTGNIYSTSYTISPSSATIPAGSSTITFTFHQTYTLPDGTERIFINIMNNGCQLYPIDSSH